MCKLICLCILARLGPYYMETQGSNSAHSIFVLRAKNIFLNIYFLRKCGIKMLDNVCKLTVLCILATLGPFYMKIIGFKLCALNFCPKGKKYFLKYIFLQSWICPQKAVYKKSAARNEVTTCQLRPLGLYSTHLAI